MQFLVFQLQASLAAWGDVAVGEYRGSRNAPGASALIGLLGAALGAVRDDEVAHAALRDGYLFAVGTVASGQLLRDHHTAQVPGRAQLKGRPHHTRRDELNMPKHEQVSAAKAASCASPPLISAATCRWSMPTRCAWRCSLASAMPRPLVAACCWCVRQHEKGAACTQRRPCRQHLK